MSTKVLRGEDKKKDAEKVLQERPLLVLFFMDGCPHCEANESAWKEAKKKAGSIPTAEIEASAVPDSSGVTGFPTMQYYSKEGKIHTTQGAKQSGDQIKKELQLGGRRRKTIRRRNRRSTRRRI
jgi:hypothetical protein